MMQRDSFQSMVFKQIRNDEVFDDLRMSCTDIESKAANNANIANYSEGNCCARCVMKTSVKKAIILMKKVFLANSIKTSYNGRNYTNSLPYQAMLVMRQIVRQSQYI